MGVYSGSISSANATSCRICSVVISGVSSNLRLLEVTDRLLSVEAPSSPNGENPLKLAANENYIIVLEPSLPTMRQYKSYLAFRTSYPLPPASKVKLLPGLDLYLPSYPSSKYIFSSITQLNGHVTDFHYSGGQLRSVSTETGTLNFAYDGGYVSAVTDSTGRSVAYSYSGDDLVSCPYCQV